MPSRRIWRNFDWFLLATVIVLLIFGVVVLRSAAGRDPQISNVWFDQALTGIVGLFALLIIASLDYAVLRGLSWVLYVITVLSLIGVLFFGTLRYGATRWFTIPGLGFDLQPGEVAKVLLTIVLAQFISERQGKRPYLETIVLSGLLVAPCVFLIMRQPNLSTALTIVFLWIMLVFVGGLEREHISTLSTVGVAALALVLLITRLPSEIIPTNAEAVREGAPAARPVAPATPTPVSNTAAGNQSGRPLTPANRAQAAVPTPTPEPGGIIQTYQIRRITNLFGGAQRGENYQSEQALIALGSGGLTGKGLFKGTQTQLGYFPVRHTDFIFSVIGEELGFIGAASCLVLILLVILRALWAGFIAKDSFGRLLCAGVAAVLFLQTYVNVGMQVSWAPVTGVVLPFMSYGRSNLIAVLIAVGIVQSVVMRHKRTAVN
jgi:rod shape determining protein RodA